MSCAANPNRPKKDQADSEAAQAAKQEKADRERIRRLIITLGDESKKVVGQIRGLAGALDDDVELHGELIIDTVVECAKHLPLKSCIFAAWARRMAEKHASVIASVVGKAMGELRTALQMGLPTVSQLMLRFLVGLGNTGTIALPQVAKLLQEIVALSKDLRSSKGGDLGIFLALSALLFLSPAAHSQIAETVDGIIAAAQVYLASRDARWKPLLRVLRSDELPDRLEALAKAVQLQKDAGWKSQSILHVPGFEPSIDGCSDLPPLAALGVTAEDVRKSKVRMQVPLVASRLLTSQAAEGPQEQMTPYDRWVLEDYILTTIEMFGRDVDECSKQILRLPVWHPHFDAVVVETIFSAMLRLPSPVMLPLFYSRLIEALTEKQKSMVKLVENAYKAIFERASDIDEDALDVLSEAFAYHLMHTGYSADLSPFTGDNVSVQAQRFLRRALERLQRLSFHQNLLHRLPEAVHVYVPPEPLPASNLPSQTKPEFERMLGLVRIREPDETKVLRYCRWLLKLNPKSEHKEEDLSVTPAIESAETRPDKERGGSTDQDTSLAVAGESEASAQGAQTEERSGQGEKRSREGDGDAEDVDAAAGKRHRKTAEEGAASKPAQNVEVKEEVKHDEERGVADATVVPASVVKQEGKQQTDMEDAEFGTAPAKSWPLNSVLELFLLAVLQHGAKTPTHLSKMLDGHLQVFAKLKPTNEEEATGFAAFVVRCVFEFWQLSGQRLEITLDALLQRGLITPRAVVEQALAQRGSAGHDSMSVWNVISRVARKSLESQQSVRAELAIAKKLEKDDVVQRCRRQLDTAVQETAELFTLIFTGLIRNHQDFEDTDLLLRRITLERVLAIGRKFYAFIKPLIDAAESRIPGVAHNPEMASVFQSLAAL